MACGITLAVAAASPAASLAATHGSKSHASKTAKTAKAKKKKKKKSTTRVASGGKSDATGGKGDKGDAGGQGAPGAQGGQGAQGGDGPQGPQGPQGIPGPYVITLPSGMSEKGQWGVEEPFATPPGLYGSSISFSIPLADAPTAHVVPPGGPLPAGCLGTLANPGAARGNLCVFTNETLGGTVTGLCDWQSNLCFDFAGTAGAYVVVTKTDWTRAEVNGAWAVTAP